MMSLQLGCHESPNSLLRTRQRHSIADFKRKRMQKVGVLPFAKVWFAQHLKHFHVMPQGMSQRRADSIALLEIPLTQRHDTVKWWSQTRSLPARSSQATTWQVVTPVNLWHISVHEHSWYEISVYELVLGLGVDRIVEFVGIPRWCLCIAPVCLWGDKKEGKIVGQTNLSSTLLGLNSDTASINFQMACKPCSLAAAYGCNSQYCITACILFSNFWLILA